jgi:hypothetical protein
MGFLRGEKMQDVVYLSIFMLCFASPEKAVQLVVYLFELKS